MNDTLSPLGFQRVKVIALSVSSLERANHFYQEVLGLQPAHEGAELVGWWLDQIILMPKTDMAGPTVEPNPRITIATERALSTQDALRARGVAIADEVQRYGEFDVGSFLDSEGNKLWFCSVADA